MTAYYNEFEPYAAEWLRNLIKKGLIADGEVDERSIDDVRPDDLRGFTQCHFFAGIGGWSYAARLAGWPDERPLWTGSCPCQPFSVAGRQEGTKDERHLWPEFFRLIAACRPDAVMGEQVAAAVGKDWLDGVFTDLEGIGYACGAAVIPACAVDAPHRRDRLWFVAHAEPAGRERRLYGPGSISTPDAGRSPVEPQRRGADDTMADASGAGPYASTQAGIHRCEESAGAWNGEPQRHGVSGDVADTDGTRSTSRVPAPTTGQEGFAEVAHDGSNGRSGPWGECDWIAGHDGKARRVKSGIRLLANGVPARVGKLRALGNAIVPALAAEIIGAFMDVTGFDGPTPRF